MAWIAGCVVLIVCAQLVAGGSKTAIVSAILLGVAPLAIYACLRHPLVLPFGLYAFLIPFNDLVKLNQFGTLSKLLGVLSAAAIAFWLVRRKAVASPSLAVALWGALALWMAATGTWALDAGLWWPLLATFMQLFVLYVLLSLMPIDELDLSRILWLIVAGGIVAALYGLFVFHNQAPNSRLWVSTGSGESNPNNFAAALLLPIAVATMRLLQAKSVLTKIALLAGLATMLGALFVTGSRGAILAVIALFLYQMWRSRQRTQAFLIAIAAGLVSLPFLGNLSERFATALSTGGAGRVSIWGVGIEAFKQHWLLGAGVGNFPLAYSEAFIRVYQHVSAGWDRGSHNLFQGAGVELGLLGLVLLTVAWIGQARALRHIKIEHPMYDVRIGLEAALLALFVSSMFLDVMYSKFTWLAFIVVMMARTVSMKLSPPEKFPDYSMFLDREPPELRSEFVERPEATVST